MKTTFTYMNKLKRGIFASRKALNPIRKIYLLLLATLAFIQVTIAQNTITIKDADLATGTYNWTNTNTYLLDGFVYLESGGVLNIQEGTVIKGIASPSTSDNASALIITVGAQINANGTSSQPIIFTSEIDDITDPSDLIATDRGLWGGLILLGDGILGNSTTTSNIEGIPTTEPRAQFGGSNNSNNAGTLRYVSIRHGGAELSPGNEINGLTLGGVGSGTTIEYIEIFSNLDDGIEFFGGAVNIKKAAVAFCGDDGFDWDLGWVGNGQFWFALQGNDEGDNGGEWDGAKPDGNSVYSNPTLYNSTFIGSGTGTVTAKNTNAILMRDATGGTVANSIFTEYAHKALEIEDLPASSGIDSYTRLQNGELKLLNNLWYGFSSFTTLDANPTTGIIRFTSGGDDTTCADLVNHLSSNSNQIADPLLNGISRFPNGQLDPRPSSISPALTSLAAYPTDPFFDLVTYKGAFGTGGTDLWTSGWTALDEYGYFVNITSIYDLKNQTDFDLQVYPNPARGVITIDYTTNSSETFVLEIVDMYGNLIKVINNTAPYGNSKVQLNTNPLAPGIYFLKASSNSRTYSKKLIVQ